MEHVLHAAANMSLRDVRAVYVVNFVRGEPWQLFEELPPHCRLLAFVAGRSVARRIGEM